MGYVTRQNYRDFLSGYVSAIEGYLRGEPVNVLTDGADLLNQTL